MSDASSERAALLEQLAGYLAWEAQLGGSAVPTQVSVPAARGGAAAERGPGPGPAEAPSPAPSSARPAPVPRVAAAPVTAPERASVPALARAPGEAVELRRRLHLVEEEVRACTRCELHRGRTQTVFARGNPEARLVFVGEGPGQEEDRTGQPFVGPAGQLLDRMVAAMGFGRDDVYICNVVKCRPPGNRTPMPNEAGACAPFLNAQLELIRPQVIVALGRCAAENMGLVAGGGWRGRWGKYREYDVMPTYHPAFLLRSPEFKRPVWDDLQRVMAKLRETP